MPDQIIAFISKPLTEYAVLHIRVFICTHDLLRHEADFFV